jgi:hypothetical protein
MDNPEEDLHSLSRELLSGIDCPDNLVIYPKSGGGNNKVFILEMNGIPKYVMKHYFRHAADPRDRCRAEWTFLEYAADAGISCVPKPIICDPDRGIAVYEYIHGHKVPTEHLSGNHITQALDFFEAINKNYDSGTPKNLLPAAESCFSMRDHLECVNRRIDRLLQMDTGSEIDRSAIHFVRNELIPRWENVRKDILEQEKQGLSGLDDCLKKRDICISPSDFGFHNAIQTDAGTVFFIDFEYAGLDDPVKMICDFFCQPEVPVPHSYLPMFSARVLDSLDNPGSHYRRLKMLLPVHTIKWCCIILNEFLPVGRARRIFANSDLDMNEIKGKQLKKAKNMFKMANTMI